MHLVQTADGKEVWARNDWVTRHFGLSERPVFTPRVFVGLFRRHCPRCWYSPPTSRVARISCPAHQPTRVVFFRTAAVAA